VPGNQQTIYFTYSLSLAAVTDGATSHTVEFCPLPQMNGSLSRLHSADEDAVSGWFTTCIREQDYSVSQKILSRGFLKFFPQRQIIFKQDFTWLLYIHIYAILQNFIQ